MTSKLDWNDLGNNSLNDLKLEAKKRGIVTPQKSTKKQIIDLLIQNNSSNKQPQPTMIDSRLLGSSSDHSQSSSQRSSTRASPIRNEKIISNQIFKDNSPHPKKANISYTENTFQQGNNEEKREHSPLAPSSISKHRNKTDSHQKSSHSTGERKVRYTNAEHNHVNIPMSRPETYQIPQKFIAMCWLSGILTILFTVIALFTNLIILIFAFINAGIFYFVRGKLDSLLEKKTHSLAPKVTSYLENECNGIALKSHLKAKFNADTYVMRALSKFLLSKKRIEIKKQKDEDQVWKLIA